MASYTFGDDDPAGQRLALVARSYEQVSSGFLAEQSASGPRVVLDPRSPTTIR